MNNLAKLIDAEIILGFVLGLLIGFGAVTAAIDDARQIKWIDKIDHTVRYEDKYCYVFKKQIHDRPVNVMICREKY